MTTRAAVLSSLVLLAAISLARAAPAPGTLTGLRLVSAEAASGSLSHPEWALDGDPKTEFSFEWANGGASLLIDLGRPCVVEAVRITNGQDNRVVFLEEVSVGPDPAHLRGLLGRLVNLDMWRPRETTEVPLPPSAARYMRIALACGGAKASIAEIAVVGRENRPERHLMCWSSDIRRDFLDKLDYLDRDLGATDLWLDSVETAFPQTVPNAGFKAWVDSGALKQFRKRGIRYWLAEHEAFTNLVREPEDLRDDLKWETTLRQMRRVYAEAAKLGFRGIVYDAEGYTGVSDAARDRYKDVADVVDQWCFADEFGYAGTYYRRGLEVGRIIHEVWGGPLLQVYEARCYAGKGDCRAGNYWWLRGIHDAGVEIWLATERTYGAGNAEVAGPAPEWERRWFVKTSEYLPQVHKAYPFAARVLPGFHPWNSSTHRPNYLPKYLDEQLRTAASCELGCWIYNEGNTKAGDPRDVLDPEACRQAGVTPEQYLQVLRKNPTCRTAVP